MTAAAIILASAAAVIWSAPFVALAVYAVRDRKAAREAEPEPVWSPEWLALLAAVDPPVHDALVCRQMETAEGWS